MMSTLRRYQRMKPSRGTTWPREVRVHVATHQPLCLGPRADMPGECGGSSELDHVRGSGGIGMKSDSIAVNAARMCSFHHRLKTEAGNTWRPKLIDAIAVLHRGCDECEAEHLARYGVPMVVEDCGHVDPVFGCPGPCQSRKVPA